MTATEFTPGDRVTTHLAEDFDTPQEGTQYEAVVVRVAKGPSGFMIVEFTAPPAHLLPGLGTVRVYHVSSVRHMP